MRRLSKHVSVVAAIASIALASTAASPSPALADQGCSSMRSTSVPTGHLTTWICGTALVQVARGAFSVEPHLSAHWRYTRCVVHQAMKIGASVYRTEHNCDGALKRNGDRSTYDHFRNPSICGVPFRVWGHFTIAYNHTRVFTSDTQEWRGNFC